MTRIALTGRSKRLQSFASYRPVQGAWRAMVWAFWLTYFGFVVLVLALRYSILPNIEIYRADIERLASSRLGQKVSIGRIEASWEGINPDLSLLDVRVADAEERPVLAFSRIEAILSWWSVPSAQLKLRFLRIEEPTLNLRRDKAGRFFIAGIPISAAQNNSDISDWVMEQRRIRVSGATLVWEDELRNAPALVLENVNFALDNNGKRHLFGLTALPPEGLATQLDVRGDFRRATTDSASAPWSAWSGQAYGEIDSADLAIWRQWIDYPVALPRGRGAVRTWVGFSAGKLDEITADVALQNLEMRLADDLPALELEHLTGRLGARFSPTGFAISGKRVELATQSEHAPYRGALDKIRIAPTDFQVEWRRGAEGQPGVGSASASQLDLGALARLAGTMPFDAHSRQLLSDYAPRGTVKGLSAKWKGDAARLQAYSLKADFDQVALKAQGKFPGFSGLSGDLAADEKSGRISLRSKTSSIDLPSIFPESLTVLDSLNAEASWEINAGQLGVEVSRFEFSGPDAAGSAEGAYHTAGDGPGTIDLTAALTRGDARAVWRYMPYAVGEGARHWLRDSLLSGHSNEAKLKLKGDLKDFPFLDKSAGQFLITVKARDVALDYAVGWPRIEKINGDLRFEGNGMVVDAQRGTIMGATLSKTRAEIPDFDKPISTLILSGKADGPTAEFLKFVEQSPVGERIDHFTQDMQASGNGHLDINLRIPLSEEKLGDSKIDGSYRFASNEITVDAALPPIKEVTGQVQFSGGDLRVPEITGTLFGGPLRIKGGLQKDGNVLITANGVVSIGQLRTQFNSPLLANLTGATSYQGEVRINKRNADLVLDSSLVGLASTFPEPFAKGAGDTLALHFEKKRLTAPASKEILADTAVRDQISASLGSNLSLRLIRRKQADGFALERGAVALGQPLQLPEKGISLGVTAKRVDVDVWRRLWSSASVGTAIEGASAPVSTLLNSISIKTPELVLLGRHFNDVDLLASPAPGLWKLRLSSRQASGDLQWDMENAGKLTARLKRFALDPSEEAALPDSSAGDAIKELPALDILADEFLLGHRHFGRLELQARNEGGGWNLNKMQASQPAGTLSGSGRWLVSNGKNRTQLDFNIESSDVGKLLERLGYPGTVRAGTARLGGKVGWNSSPADFDYASLSGDLSLDAAKGQFVKLNPGAAGKLLGLISLQGLPRRISLDFKDVFSDGFAFDSITSKASIQNGVMRTDRLQIDGPSARVVMRGEVDLKHETQRLNVNVQPELGGTVALGVALINPIAGAATWVAHKLLQNPLNQMFGFEYLITGSWDDPVVEKISGSEPPANAIPRLPPIENPLPSSLPTDSTESSEPTESTPDVPNP